MMRAAAEWPQLVDEVKTARRRIAALEGVLDVLLDADGAIDSARLRRTEASMLATKVRWSTE